MMGVPCFLFLFRYTNVGNEIGSAILCKSNCFPSLRKLSLQVNESALMALILIRMDVYIENHY